MKQIFSKFLFFKGWSLVQRITFIIALGWLVFVIITIFTINIYLKDKLIEIHFDSERNHLSNLVTKVEDSFEMRKQAIKKISSHLVNNQATLIDNESIVNILQVAQLNNLFEEFVLLDPSATTLVQYPYLSERVNVNYSDRPFIKKLLETQQLMISAPLLGRVTGLPSIFFAQPIIDDQSNLLGILTARVALENDYILNQISSEFVRYDGQLMIADLHNNLLVAATDADKLMIDVSDDQLANDIINNDASGQVKDKYGRYWLYSSVAFNHFEWLVINLTPKDEILASVKDYTAQYLLIILPLIIASGVIFTLWIYSVFIPMRQALSELEKNLVNQTGYSVLQISRLDEVGKLLSAVNELQLMKSNQEKMKDDLLSIVTHEIRTPITAIRASISMLSVDEAQLRKDSFNRLIEISQRNTDKLLWLINDLLDLSSLAQGKLSLSCESVNLFKVVSDSVDEMQSIANSANINLKFTSIKMDIYCYIDTFRVQQVLFNLLSNAIKFSDINSDVEVKTYSENRFAFITVSDQGIGIPLEYHKKIFERFTQVNSSDTRGHKGTGLGLAIANELIKEMRGEITLQSEVGVGTTFCIKLPVIE